MEELTDFEFGLEMRILWQNADIETRAKLRTAVHEYFDIAEKESFHVHERGDKIINFMQSSV